MYTMFFTSKQQKIASGNTLYSVAHIIQIRLIQISGYFEAIVISLPFYNTLFRFG